LIVALSLFEFVLSAWYLFIVWSILLLSFRAGKHHQEMVLGIWLKREAFEGYLLYVARLKLNYCIYYYFFYLFIYLFIYLVVCFYFFISFWIPDILDRHSYSHL
jgi:hypothetical protein